MIEPTNRWKMGGGATVLITVAILLWIEFSEPALAGWNIVLALLMGGTLIAAFFLQRFFRAHIGEIGEARFDTHNPDRTNG
ncbi:MAG: hypothetical protein P0Y56_01170 [Candidatus Andeanibacterium colombiense]|uniref:Uncharacterized protein n=1 Tax=Candidatus Andeanibacterium colombiense TaxID=3121345 RepID=A0AAJ6BNC1_9SPHN|nr:MAG: hypothetical protein P0Y56_01170 [Sphingomonadaceae bacterium]